MNVNIGYQHPRVLAAMKAQLENLVTIAPATANLARGEAAKQRIVDLAPAGFSKVFFTNAGADANENAIPHGAALYRARQGAVGLSFLSWQHRQRDRRYRRLAPGAE
ncbi:aminotransferase class III-fold pyridoxal phosphate-dependent enzyme [Klebsiella pneumoniae subsp. pneumoniae]|nr:aminotransferase class III-fold pyridoxal phosphate-dependent enzyme [Klebsiella pneumoniae subsp. pneumoniae]